MLDNCNIIAYKPNLIELVNKEQFNEYTKNGKLYYTAIIKGLYLKLTDNNLRIKNSLKKYISKDPYYDLSVNDIQHIISDLSNQLNFDISESRLTKMEFGMTIKTDEDPSKYIQLFGSGTRCKESKYSTNGKVYAMTNKDNFTKSNSLMIYDKGKESISMDKLLRIEFKVPKRIKQSLKLIAPLLLKDFTTKEGFNMIFDKLIGFYNRISKKNESNFNYSVPNEYLDFVYNDTLSTLEGYEKYIEINRIKYINKEISSYTYYQINNMLNSKFIGNDTSKNELINEIETKISSKYDYLINN